MTSSTTPKGPASVPQISTQRSSEISRPSSNIVSLERSASNLREKERRILRSALSCLDAVSVEGTLTYADICRHETDLSAHYIGSFIDQHQFVSKKIDKDILLSVVNCLNDNENDSPNVRVALYELWLTTRRERMTAEDRDAMLRTYLRRCAAYPEDVVLQALSELSHERIYFPSWAEVQERLDRFSGWRSGFIKALRRLYTKLKGAQ